MALFTELDARVDRLRALLGGDSTPAEVPAAIGNLIGEDALAVIETTSAAIRALRVVQVAAVGRVAELSSREAGHSGLAQSKGHRTPVSLVQEITGSTKGEAAKSVRLGQDLLSTVPTPADTSAGDDGDAAVVAEPWDAPLRAALLAGQVTTDQHDAIRRGLGDPPVPDHTAGSDDDRAAIAEAIAAAWSTAVAQLVDEAACRTVEELRVVARSIRDMLDPEGAVRRFDERFQARSFRMWTDADGIRRASMSFDDESAAWTSMLIDAAMRPRRGGPRFVDSTEAARAKALEDDPRTNDQLTFDLIMDTLRAGTLADAKAVFGTRQAGVRIVVTKEVTETATDADAGGAGDLRGRTELGLAEVGHVEDGGATLPAWLIEQRLCDSGHSTCTIDGEGNPLDLGREQRLFSPKQKIALSIRDGGCRWRGCDRPASYCEAHHIDHWYEHYGRTDIDRGILLCRFHHMQLHHGGWHITREGKGDFVLHPPGSGEPTALPPRLHLTYAWAGIDPPPPRRFRPAA